MHYRSVLFVPGNRPERFEKACASGADLVCIDLEDAVSPHEKDNARKRALYFVFTRQDGRHTGSPVGIRINGINTEEGKKDIAALKTSGLTLPFLMIPKVATKGEMSDLDDDLPNALGVFCPIIESAEGLLNAADILSNGRVKLALFGAVDFSADVDCDLSWDALLHARSVLSVAAAAHDVTLFDVPHINVRDLDDCEATTRRNKTLGIHARSAIHPAQIERIHAALAPTDADIDQAEKVIAAYQKADGDVALVDGKLIEMPLLRKAKRIMRMRK